MLLHRLRFFAKNDQSHQFARALGCKQQNLKVGVKVANQVFGYQRGANYCWPTHLAATVLPTPVGPLTLLPPRYRRLGRPTHLVDDLVAAEALDELLGRRHREVFGQRARADPLVTRHPHRAGHAPVIANNIDDAFRLE